MLHILRSLQKDYEYQWRATCSCGHESIHVDKVEAVNLHRTHIAQARQEAA